MGEPTECPGCHFWYGPEKLARHADYCTREFGEPLTGEEVSPTS